MISPLFSPCRPFTTAIAGNRSRLVTGSLVAGISACDIVTRPSTARFSVAGGGYSSGCRRIVIGRNRISPRADIEAETVESAFPGAGLVQLALLVARTPARKAEAALGKDQGNMILVKPRRRKMRRAGRDQRKRRDGDLRTG
ncbi:hypothetical protein CLOP_g3337 [Closterium sp. NIES-67]|nr:hypothetical protein CLOP_g3337 [Closterium sp. NIES-67]